MNTQNAIEVAVNNAGTKVYMKNLEDTYIYANESGELSLIIEGSFSLGCMPEHVENIESDLAYYDVEILWDNPFKETARISDFRVVEIVKRRAKTTIVRELTSHSNETFTVKNHLLREDNIVPLNSETAKTAQTVLNINNPQWGVKAFHYKAQELMDGDYAHVVGQGSNSKVLFKGEMSLWRVMS